MDRHGKNVADAERGVFLRFPTGWKLQQSPRHLSCNFKVVNLQVISLAYAHFHLSQSASQTHFPPRPRPRARQQAQTSGYRTSLLLPELIDWPPSYLTNQARRCCVPAVRTSDMYALFHSELMWPPTISKAEQNGRATDFVYKIHGSHGLGMLLLFCLSLTPRVIHSLVKSNFHIVAVRLRHSLNPLR